MYDVEMPYHAYEGNAKERFHRVYQGKQLPQDIRPNYVKATSTTSIGPRA